MKTIWNLLAVVAILNLLAIAGFVGFLAGTDRLSAERLRLVASQWKETVSAQVAREAAEQAAEAARVAEEEAKAKEKLDPVTAEDMLRIRLAASEADRQRIERMRAEVEVLQSTLRRDRAALDQERAALAADRAAWEAQQQRIAETEGSVQFKRAVSTLESLQAKTAKDLLKSIIAGDASGADLAGLATPADPASGSPAGGAVGAGSAVSGGQPGLDLAVSYLNAMQDRTRSKILAEMAKDDAPLAAGLLERIRTRGLVAIANGN